MSNYVLFFAIFFTCVIGLFEILKTLYVTFFFHRIKTKTIALLPLSSATEDIEYFIRGALLKTEGQLIIVDMGMNETECNIISRLNERYHRIAIVKQEELCKYISAVC